MLRKHGHYYSLLRLCSFCLHSKQKPAAFHLILLAEGERLKAIKVHIRYNSAAHLIEKHIQHRRISATDFW